MNTGDIQWSEAFEIVKNEAGREGLKCLSCGFTSWNLNDVRYRYCGNCHVFLDLKLR